MDIEITRKNIKHIHLRVQAPEGKVRVSAPRHLRPEALQVFLESKMDWIRKQQQVLRERHHEPVHDYVDGEIHYASGEPYTLQVLERAAPPQAVIAGTILQLGVRPDATRAKKQAVLEAWYRRRLHDALPALITHYEQQLQVSVREFGIKKMKTRWGTCNIRARRIWFNLELAKKSPACLEYIVVHEMAHLLERSHGRRFVALMDRFLPDWRACKAQLNQAL